jgi:hypothetical protein
MKPTSGKLRTTIAVCAAMLSVGAMTTAASALSPSKVIATHDPDKDGTLNRGEVIRAAIYKFRLLDHDHDGSLDKAELSGVLNSHHLVALDHHRDGTLRLGEYLRLVKRTYRYVNTDHDRTLESDELDTPAGHFLMRLIY